MRRLMFLKKNNAFAADKAVSVATAVAGVYHL